MNAREEQNNGWKEPNFQTSDKGEGEEDPSRLGDLEPVVDVSTHEAQGVLEAAQAA